MKKIPFVYFLLGLLFLSCNSNNTKSLADEKDSFNQVVDSFYNVDVHLSFNGLALGTPLCETDKKGIYGDGIAMTKINDCSYQGTVGISLIDADGNEYIEYPKVQVDIVDGLIAKISLLSESWNLCKFYIETYNNRYYESEPRDISKGGAYEEYYGWYFKEQSINIRRLYHTDSEYGVYRITDGVFIEYEHSKLCKKLEKIIASRDSLKEDNINKRKMDLSKNI